jgi:hypothetical protein
MNRPEPKKLVWTVLFVLVAVVLVTLLVLIGLGYLVLPSSPPSTITISEIQWTIAQGNTSNGVGWFGPSSFVSGENADYPRTVPVNQAVTVVWNAQNNDGSTGHVVYSVAILNAGFSIVSEHPALPECVPVNDEGISFHFGVGIPSGASGSYALKIDVNALNGPPQNNTC